MPRKFMGTAVGVMWLSIAGLAAHAQEDTPADFNAVRTPTSPAFVLLGVEPTSVERPNSPSDFAASILDRPGNLTTIPKDFALEVSPYWWYEHEQLTWRDDTARKVGQSILRTATISLATADIGDQANPVTGVSVGVRFSPFSGQLSGETINALMRIEGTITEESRLLDRLVDGMKRDTHWQERRDEAVANLAAAPKNTTLYNLDLDTLKAIDSEVMMMKEHVLKSADYQHSRDAIRAKAEKFTSSREGFLFEVAGGASGYFPDGTAKQGKLRTWGVWLTAGNQADAFSYLAVARYLGAMQDTLSNVIDLGGRLIYSFERVALSAEAVCRFPTESGQQKSDWRVAGVADYELNGDVWLEATFGQGFGRETKGSLLAQLGLSLNINGKRYSLSSP